MKGFIVLLGFLLPMLSFAQCDSFDGTLSVNVTGFTSSAGYTQEYVIVDNTGTILQINGTGTFVGLPDGNYTVYAVNYEGSTPAILAPGLLWSNVDSFDQNSANCFHSISNNYTVCSNTQLCNTDDIVVTTSNFTTTAGYQQIYVLVDLGTGTSVASNTTGTFNQGNYVGIGNYQVYAVNTNDAGVVALLTGNGAWSSILSAINASCADVIGPKNFSIINCCDLIISGTVGNETCIGNDGSINLTITGSATYDVTINGLLYTPLNAVTANSYAIPNLSDGTYQVIVFDINDNSCDDTLDLTILDGGQIYNLNETVSACINATVNYPDGTSEVIAGNTTHTSNLTTAQGCDSIIVTTVTANSIITNTVNESVCFGTQYTSPQGNNYSAGTFNETLVSASGCDSVVTYTITELAAITNTLNESVCIGTQYTSPQGNNYSAGTFNETFVTASGCDSVVTYNVSELITLTSTLNATVCFGDQFTSTQGNSYGAGSFNETYTSSLGCDSIVSFIIAEIPAITNTIFVDICFGALYISPQGNNYSAGTFNEIFAAGSGCDSTVIYDITELAAIANDVFETVCFGTLFSSPQGNDYGVGVFDETYVSVSGCDSVVTFNITELAPLLSNTNELVCFGEQFTSPQGNNYGVGSFDEVYISASGCDSTVTFIINEIPSITSSSNQVVCFGEQFTSPQGNNYGGGVHIETYLSAIGCDSVVTFNITELPAISSTSFQSVCFGEHYISSNGTVYPAGTFTEILTASNGCDSSVTLVISEFDLVVADFNSDFYGLTSLNTEASFINTSTGSGNYIWNFGDGSPTTTEESPIHGFPEFESGEYTVTLIAINAAGCSDTITQSIVVQEELIFYVPNSFTPDGDEFNQTFHPVFSSGFDPFDFSLLIFNRWGEVIFESRDTTIGWDGTYHGQSAQDGTYTWKIEFKESASDKRRMEMGHVNMLR
jgi:gliding motility-associated-like protein